MAARGLKAPERSTADAEELARAVIDEAFTPEDWDAPLKTAGFVSMFPVFAEAAVGQVALTGEVAKRIAADGVKSPQFCRRWFGTDSPREVKTTAQDIAERLEIEVPDGVSLEYPEWVLNSGLDTLRATFAQDYWQRVSVTTRGDLFNTIRDAFNDGVGIPGLAARIREIRGPSYAAHRARNTARTETGNMANAGNIAGIRRVGDETGLQMGKEWLSVFGSTTRPTHANTDGQTRLIDEDFELDGFPCEWPSHYSLPARHRCSCQCSTLSAFLGEALLPIEEGYLPDKIDPKTMVQELAELGEDEAKQRLRAVQTLEDLDGLDSEVERLLDSGGGGIAGGRLEDMLDEINARRLELLRENPEIFARYLADGGFIEFEMVPIIDVDRQTLEDVLGRIQGLAEDAGEGTEQARLRDLVDRLRAQYLRQPPPEVYNRKMAEAFDRLEERREAVIKKAAKQRAKLDAQREEFEQVEAEFQRVNREAFDILRGREKHANGSREWREISERARESFRRGQELRDRRNKLRKDFDKALDKHRDSVLKTLELPKDERLELVIDTKQPAPVDRVSAGQVHKQIQTPGLRAQARKVATRLAKIMHKKTARRMPTGAVTIENGEVTKGGIKVKVHENKTGRAFAADDAIYMDALSDDSVFAHEFMHVFEQGESSQEMLQEFRRRRTVGQDGKATRRRLNEIFPDSGYKDSEWTEGDDNWAHSLGSTGGPAAPFYVGKPYGKKYTEVLTMGFQAFWDDPGGFAERDPEFFRLVFGILRGDFE